MKCVIRSAAKDDILRQFRYYLVDQNSPEAASRFLKAVERTIDGIVQQPRAGAPKHLPNKSLAGLRSRSVPGFEDIRIYYLAHQSLIRVVRVLHGKRDINSILEEERFESETPDGT